MTAKQLDTAKQLEQRIARTLAANGAQTSHEIASQLTALEAEISASMEAAQAAHEASLDPALTPDPITARHAAENAKFKLSRLQTLLPRLQKRYQIVLAHEEAAQARKQSEPLIAERNRLAHELQALLPYFHKIADCFVRISANNATIGRFHASLPAHVALFIRDAELKARGLECFTRENPSIMKDAVLPGLDGRMLWPPPRTESDVTAFALVAHNPRYSPQWSRVLEEENAAAEAAQAEAAKRHADEARERQIASGGPVWWEGEKR
jgi:hypothetical protein